MSPAKLGREANLLDIDCSYQGLYDAIQKGQGLEGTIEFFPEEGKYHFDGHRKCHLVLSPGEAEAAGNLCPVCKKEADHGGFPSDPAAGGPAGRLCKRGGQAF